ncbi:hypothetical protein Tco_0838945 [Tanacetum coccineum]|uniref:Xylulose kinase-1 n=1 Tax=Tanacetum coccineum TaxID=301880 RepID=A0ABQ5AT95_9ASTR
MANLKFADTLNMVAFLSKPEESDGFEQIVDFLNAHPIKYALTVNPTIYTSCIQQFWSTVKAKTINEEVQLHALVDGKKIIVTESTIKRDLQLEDAEVQRLLDGMSLVALWHLVSKGFSGRVTSLFPTMVVPNQSELCEGSAMPTNPYYTHTIIKSSTQPQKTQKSRKPKRNDTQVPQPSGPTDIVTDEVVHKELSDSLVRAATTASSLEAEQGSGNTTKTRSKATPNKSSSLGTTSGGGPRRQETMRDTIAQTRFENVSKHSYDLLLVRGNTLQSDEDSLKLKELMELCTNLQQKVLDLEKTKTTQQNEIASLKRRVKKLEKKKRSRTHGLKRLHKVGMSRKVVSSSDEEDLDDADNEMFDVDTLTGDEVIAEQEVAAKDVNLTIDEVTLAQALAALKSVKPKVKRDVIEEPSVPVSAASASTKVSAVKVQNKGKGKMIEHEPVKPKKKDVQIMLDEEVAKKLQAEFDEEERLAKEKDEANVALTEEWDDIQAKIKADHELAQRLQAEEQEELSV